jgi:hypothetical protein
MIKRLGAVWNAYLSQWPMNLIIAVALLVFVLVLPLLLVSEEDVLVAHTEWRHTYTIERFAERAYDGFHPPTDASDVQFVGTRVSGYRRVLSHYRTESYSTACGQTCSGSGNTRSCSTRYCSSTRQVPVYRSEAIYSAYYAWRAWRWARARVAIVRGQDEPVRAATKGELRLCDTCQGRERERFSRADDYIVTFIRKDGETWKDFIDSEAGFSAFSPGQRRTIEVNGYGAVVAVKDPR